ncbi:Ubiquitin-conjugating enzyme E2 E2 [Channa argus]|uniref:Ubiquitin-conjugating enzyme E2 E2 n=1 Tax=Channa argus TaxID=215402 RepID=A0A6G1QZ00_CHAAH|nr:Ubiquitin-conjugating enzyme E2 E2 [Channa argus]
MDAIYNLLEKHRLHSYYYKFIELGVKDERDFLDSVTDTDLHSLGLSHLEKNRFSNLKKTIGRLRAPAHPATPSVQKSKNSFSLLYTYPKCPEPKCIKDMDPAQNTVEDLMLRICHLETIDSSRDVCLYTLDGMPLTEDPFFNTWSLQDRHIKSEDVIYAIFTPKENLTTPSSADQVTETGGNDSVRCHIMLKGDYEVMVDLAKDTIVNLKNKLANESGIPAHVLHYKGETGDANTLESCGISEGSTVLFSLSSFAEEVPETKIFFTNDVVPSVQQTPKGISVFLSSLNVIKHKSPVVPHKNLIAYIRNVTGCHPLAQSLHQLLIKNEIVTRTQKIAVYEGLYTLFREILPKFQTNQGDMIIEDLDVFEYSRQCWAYLMSEAKKNTSEYENYAPYCLMAEEGSRFCEPVTVPGTPVVLERGVVLQKIKDGEKIPNCTEECLKETSLKKATQIEKILLSVHPSVTTYHQWISHESMTGQNFHINATRSFGSIAEEMKAFPHLNVTPPLVLKDLGCQDRCLVLLNEENLGVYLYKNKLEPETIEVYDCLLGKSRKVDVNVLAATTGDHRDDYSFVTTRTPKEAILVLIDTSSSMGEDCYGNATIQKIHAVKQLFDNFATRSMAYDFHHVIGLVKFDSTVTMLHTFTETLEKFKEKVHTLEAAGRTQLYDALQQGVFELGKVKEKFPDCRLRILCLTDGQDVGSSNKPVAVAVNLIKSNITVDSVLLGKVQNKILHGISIATGGCCFKPETSKDGLKLFEIETVLSLEMRKPKNKADPSSITDSLLTGFFATHAYDEFPEAILPSQMNCKVTLTESALKTKIREAKDGRFMEKDRRILEELKSLHCHPHPYVTIFPLESDFTFWKILLEGPPDTPYENGVFELFCQFGPDYPVKPPTIRFVTRIYHCNINSVGRICHNIFDRNYNAQITMRDILDALYGLLIAPEPQDPLDSILAEEFLTSHVAYEEQAKKHTEETAGQSLDDLEKKLVGPVEHFVPQHLICPLTKKIFVDPVKTKKGIVYERKAIEKHLKTWKYDPLAGKNTLLRRTDCMPDREMKKMVTNYRSNQILETSL